ncbi:822_t:CDS:2, partial [Racocetra fulgida]
SIKQYTDFLFEKQRLWNKQLQININSTLTQIVQPNMPSSTLTHLTDLSQQQQRLYCAYNNPQIMDKEKETTLASGKYSPIPVLNDLITRALRLISKDKLYQQQLCH